MDEFIKSANKKQNGQGQKIASPKKIKKKNVSLDKKKARAGYLFVLPFIIGFLLIYLPIIGDSIRYSFNEIEILRSGGYELHWVGFDNYITAITQDSTFVTTLMSGLGTFLLEVPAIVIFSLFVAIILNQKMAGRAAFRAIFFIPVILATGLISDIEANTGIVDAMQSDSSIDTGSGQDQVSQIVDAMDIKALFSGMVVGEDLLEYVAQLVNNIYDIVNRCGVQMLIFLSGLQAIDPAIYESCQMEGASAWETFWKITLPMISPMILVNAVYTIIDSFTSSSNSVMGYISGVYSSGSNGQVVSSAMSWMYFLLVILIVAVIAGLLRLVTFYQRRD